METILTLAPHLPAFYNRTLLMNAYPKLLHELFSDYEELPLYNSKTIMHTKYAALPPVTTPLTPGITPQGNHLSPTEVEFDVDYYGDYIMVEREVSFVHEDQLLTKVAARQLGPQAGQSRDMILRDKFNAGTNVIYANGTARGDIGSSHKITTTLLDTASLTLRLANADYISEMVRPSQDVGTVPVPPSFFAIVHPRITNTLKGLNGWIPLKEYATNAGMVMPGEKGAYEDIRFLETTNAKVFAGEGNGGIDVYSILIFGAHATGVSSLSGEALENIVMPFGSAGAADPLKQRATSGWRMSLGGGVLQQLFMVRVEVAA